MTGKRRFSGRLRDRLGISVRRQRQATRAMQLGLIGFLFVGLDRGNPGIVVNTLVALGVTELPALLERDYNLPMDPALVLWLTTAVFLHALGTLGPYQNVWWWDHVTHMLSSSLMAGAGYASVRAMEVHSDQIVLPPRFLFVFILTIVVAFGVLWEVLEFAIGLAAKAIGTGRVLTQYGLDDSMLDLIFNTFGGVIVAASGTAHLTGMVSALAARLGAADHRDVE